MEEARTQFYIKSFLKCFRIIPKKSGTPGLSQKRYHLVNASWDEQTKSEIKITGTACGSLLPPLLFHISMTSGWERVRLRIETKENLKSDNTAGAMSTISSHILDTSLGKAVPNTPVTVYRLDNNTQWQQLGQACTNEDGRVTQLVPPDDFKSGIYKLHFNVHPYYEQRNLSSFYPFIEIVVQCKADEHYHIPLLLTAYGYSTYRGS